jgi:hypothetical protein
MAEDSTPKLEEPGWPKLDSGVPDAGTSFTNSFLKMTALQNQKLDLQQRVAEMNMHMLTSKQEHDIQMKRLALDTANTIADNNRADKNYNSESYYREQSNERAQEAHDKKLDDADELDQQQADYQNGLTAIQQYRGSREYETKLAELNARFPKAAASKTGIAAYKSAGEDHNLAVRTAIDLNTAKWKQLQGETGTTFFNDRNNPEMGPLFDDNLIQPVTTKVPGKGYDPKDPSKHQPGKKYQLEREPSTYDSETGEEIPGKAKRDKSGMPIRAKGDDGKPIPSQSQNYVQIPQVDETGKPAQPKRIAVKQIMDMRKRYQDLVSERNNIGSQINNPYVQARGTSSSYSQGGLTEKQLWEQGMRNPNMAPDKRVKMEQVGRKRGWIP